MDRSVLLIGNFLSSHKHNKSPFEDLRDILIKRGWKVNWASQYPQKFLRILDMLWTIVDKRKEYQVAFIAVFSGPAFIWAELCTLALRILHKPFILSLHGGDLPGFSRRWPGRVERLLGNSASVTTPSHFLSEVFQTSSLDIMIIPNGINLANYSFLQRIKTEPKIVWMRALHQIYNPIMAVEVLGLIKENYPKSTLVMIGPDKQDGSLASIHKKTYELKLSANIELSGWIDKIDISKYLNLGDIFINTTNFESFGVSVLEAAACGMCIVTTAVGELPFLWSDGEDALLVPPGDSVAMAQAVFRILENPNLANRLSNNARRKAEQYDWSVIIPKYEELFGTTIIRSRGN